MYLVIFVLSASRGCSELTSNSFRCLSTYPFSLLAASDLDPTIRRVLEGLRSLLRSVGARRTYCLLLLHPVWGIHSSQHSSNSRDLFSLKGQSRTFVHSLTIALERNGFISRFPIIVSMPIILFEVASVLSSRRDIETSLRVFYFSLSVYWIPLVASHVPLCLSVVVGTVVLAIGTENLLRVVSRLYGIYWNLDWLVIYLTSGGSTSFLQYFLKAPNFKVSLSFWRISALEASCSFRQSVWLAFWWPCLASLSFNQWSSGNLP